MSPESDTATLEVPRPNKHDNAVLVTYEQIANELCPQYFGYAPPVRSVKRWLLAANLRRIRMNSRVGSGGGLVYFNRSAVKEWLRHRTQG